MIKTRYNRQRLFVLTTPVHAHYPLIAIRHVPFGDTAAEPSTEIVTLLLRDAVIFGDRSSGMGLRRNQGVATAAQGHTYYKCVAPTRARLRLRGEQTTWLRHHSCDTIDYCHGSRHRRLNKRPPAHTVLFLAHNRICIFSDLAVLLSKTWFLS
jgi:hypothetical protein